GPWGRSWCRRFDPTNPAPPTTRIFAPEKSSCGMEYLLTITAVVNEVAVDVGHPVSIVPFEHSLHRCPEIDLGIPAQLLHRARRIRHHLTQVVTADRDDLDRGIRCEAEVLPHQIIDLFDRAAPTGRHIERPNHVRLNHGQIDGGNEVRHVEEISHGVGTKARLLGLETLVKRRNGPDGEARSGDIGKPQRNPAEVAGGEVLLSGDFRYCVARERRERMIHRYRVFRSAAVTQYSLEIDEAFHSERACGLD